MALRLNDLLAAVRRRLGMPYWSLSRWLKDHVKNAVEYIDRFEAAVALEGQRRQVHGVVCGHIHKAEMRQIGPILYCNDGDWVESCTALVEDYTGKLQIMTWTRALPTHQPQALLQQAAE
jgi:UDP-2,3-diacylglucosamine pyrophosphatase LpxH